jgi:hypothetical protein
MASHEGLRGRLGPGPLVGEGLNVEKDPGEAATVDYSGERPFAITGGTVKR